MANIPDRRAAIAEVVIGGMVVMVHHSKDGMRSGRLKIYLRKCQSGGRMSSGMRMTIQSQDEVTSGMRTTSQSEHSIRSDMPAVFHSKDRMLDGQRIGQSEDETKDGRAKADKSEDAISERTMRTLKIAGTDHKAVPGTARDFLVGLGFLNISLV
jgi:hypothetical protein